MDKDEQQPGRRKEAQSQPEIPNAKDGVRESTPAPSDGEIFGTSFAEGPAYDDIFSSLAEFESGSGSADVGGLRRIASGVKWPHLHVGTSSRVQKILLAGIIAIAAVLAYVLVVGTKRPSPPDQRIPTGSPALGHASPHETAREASSQEQATLARFPNPVGGSWESEPRREEPSMGSRTLPSPEPLSLQVANKLYLRRDFEHALATYEKLYQRLPATEENRPLRDFLLLRMALCSKNSGNATQADSMFRTVSLSRLPVLRALARYHQSTTLMGRKRYLEAAAQAYQTLGLIEVVDYDKKWVSAVQQECGALVAEAVTRNLLSLCDADAGLPAELWDEHPDIDPFINMDEPQLQVFLASGTEQLDKSILGPQIRRVGEGSQTRETPAGASNKGPTPRWSVICNGASIEELLARFATNAGLSVRWTENGQGLPHVTDRAGGPQTVLVEDNVRARPVYLYLTSATAQQVVAIAAGGVGLLARMDDKGNVLVQDPASYSLLADHVRLLTDESILLWQRSLLSRGDDQRAPSAHFATGLLQSTRGRFDEAIAEYKLVASRFAKHALAPHALLQSGELKVRLRDYVGAHADLKQLVELYPESELSDRACLHLADATMKAGLYEEATGLYRKVYNLGLSVESQTESSLGAGRCFHETGNYEEAAKWLSQYVTLARDQNRPGYHAACLLLGKTYLALHKPQQAHAALNLALKGELSRQQHVETIAVLVKTYMEQGLFLEALNTLESTGGWQLSQQETIELLLLRAQALRSIGLTQKAIALLEGNGQYLPSPELQGKWALELAKCYIADGKLEPARKTLSEAFAATEPGPLSGQIGREMASTCLRLGQTAQAVSICSQLLQRASPSERQSVLDLLTSAYRKQGQYDRAVTAMLDRYEVVADANTAPLIRND